MGYLILIKIFNGDFGMPIYEYHCKGCNKDFEVLQKITEKPMAKCPDCGKRVKRILSQTSFTLKGGGWYKDGYSGATVKKASSTEKKDTPKADPKPPAKKD